MEKPVCELIGEDGNIFMLGGKAAKCLKRAGMADKAEEMLSKIMDSKSYQEALRIISDYVEIE